MMIKIKQNLHILVFLVLIASCIYQYNKLDCGEIYDITSYGVVLKLPTNEYKEYSIKSDKFTTGMNVCVENKDRQRTSSYMIYFITVLYAFFLIHINYLDD